jgi:glycine/D-amino acid oxidase-like deaminating enzyme
MTSRTDIPRIAVLGAGPIGLEAALYAATLKLPVTVYERGRPGEYLHQWGHVRLFSPFGTNGTPLGRARLRADDPGRDLPGGGDFLTGREHLAAYLQPLAKSPLLQGTLRLETAVLHLGRRGLLKEEGSPDVRRRQPFRLLLRQGKKEWAEEADVVLDCTGTYGQARWLGEGGIPAVGELAARPHIAAGLEDVLGDRKAHYADRTTLVLGAGHSAATTVSNLSKLAEKHPATWVVWLARGSATQPIRRLVNDPLRERDQLAVRANTLATRGEGNVEFHAQAVVESVECAGPDRGFKVAARCAGKLLTWEVDRVIANLGGTPNTELYRELQVHECFASLGPMGLASALAKNPGADFQAVPSPSAAALRNPEPNFYILGAKSFGRNSAFLLRTGFEQVRQVFTLITGKSDLDLYNKR